MKHGVMQQWDIKYYNQIMINQLYITIDILDYVNIYDITHL